MYDYFKTKIQRFNNANMNSQKNYSWSSIELRVDLIPPSLTGFSNGSSNSP
jgi:hypothetical protein